MKFNRILLVTGSDSAETTTDLELLQARDYTVHTLRDVVEHLRALNLVQNESNVRQCMVHVLCDVHAMVLHHDLRAEEVLYYKQLCYWTGKHVVMLGDLPLYPPDRQDAFDDANLWSKVEDDTTTLRDLAQVAKERVRHAVASAKAAWLRFEGRFNTRYGWFFTNGRKQLNRNVPMEVIYPEPGALSTTG